MDFSQCALNDANVLKPECIDICLTNDCSRAVLTHCTGDNLNTEACQAYCFSKKGGKYNCDDHIEAYCKTPQGQEKAICSCYMPPETYIKYVEELKASLPPSVANEIYVDPQYPYCYYPPCSLSDYTPRVMAPCPGPVACMAYMDLPTIDKFVHGPLYEEALCLNPQNGSQLVKPEVPKAIINIPGRSVNLVLAITGILAGVALIIMAIFLFL